DVGARFVDGAVDDVARLVDAELGGIEEDVAREVDLDEARGRHLVVEQAVRIDEERALLARHPRADVIRGELRHAVEVHEPVGGSGGLIGTDMAAKAAPDGYTLLLVSVAFAFNPAIYKLPYDPATAFAPVAILGAGPVVIAVSGKLPVDSLQGLVALAKAKPG